MAQSDVVELVSELPCAHGVLDEPTLDYRMVYCEVQSVSQTEVYQARAVGLNPEIRLTLPHRFEYRNEKMCRFHGVMYDVIRTYLQKGDGIELTIQRVEGNADVQRACGSTESA